MNARSSLFAALVAATTLVYFGPATAGDKNAGAGPTAAQLEAARTPAHNEALARAYEEEAAGLDRKADAHEAMARTYRSGGPPKHNSPAMVSHCERMVSQYRAAAKEARALVSEHWTMAEKAGQ